MAGRNIALAFALVGQANAVRVSPPTDLRDMLDDDAVLMPSMLEEHSNATGPSYIVDMLKLKVNGYQAAFCGHSKDGCKTVDNYPGPHTHSELTWAKVVENLQKVPELQGAGKIYRGNELGYIKLNEGLWARDYKTMGLGVSVEQHKFFRPIADRLLGAAGEGKFWSEEMIRASLDDYFQGKSTIDTNAGIFTWSTRLMHKIHLNMDLSAEDTQKFMDLQNGAVVKGALPLSTGLLGYTALQDTRDYFLAKYMKAIVEDTRGAFPKDVTQEQVHFMASSLMDSMLFAGGLSVGNLIKVSLCVLYADPSPWMTESKQLTDGNVDQFVFEVIRRYPAVVGFPWYPLPKKEVRIIMNVAMALRDPEVWAESGPVLDFKLRPLETYRKYMGVAWAEPANGPEAWTAPAAERAGHLIPMSRGCPGQSLSVTIIKVFLKRWMATQQDWAVVAGPEGGLSFADSTPFVNGDITLAKVRKAGTATLVRKTWFGYAGDEASFVITAGDASQPAMLHVYNGVNYRKDDPAAAVERVVLDADTHVQEASNFLASSDKTAECFIVKRSKSVIHVCAAGTDSLAKRGSWMLELRQASM